MATFNDDTPKSEKSPYNVGDVVYFLKPRMTDRGLVAREVLLTRRWILCSSRSGTTMLYR